ncbi:sensor histidine kinase KdpD [Chitinophaga sp. sic0106]|uniref:sensor histidine kinase n=1 Tax=Chitinophaga sp. sic0106 TaxID=2854785 RepID=UPI001C47CF81|nr:HAMP domain-containing sensor histidine kinase [Chitinophaga sp. sic0106]MBV7531001.1 HAMP domain-containing histidine kinase [Chitinophaga sp. sic0106]
MRTHEKIVMPEWAYKPFRLTQEEVNDPTSVILDFFEETSLPELRQTLDKLQDELLINSRIPTRDYLWFRADLERCLEASYLLAQEVGEELRTARLMQDIGHELSGKLGIICMMLDELSAQTGFGHKPTELALSELSLVANLSHNILKNMLHLNESPEILVSNLSIRDLISQCRLFSVWYAVLKQGNLVIDTEFLTLTEVKSDGVMLQQCLLNLIQNAFKYAIPGSDVSLIIANTDNEVSFKVLNKGKRLSDDLMAKIFERYFMVEPGQGSAGLGLFITKTYVQLLGGNITVHSEEHQVIFTITIPI